MEEYKARMVEKDIKQVEEESEFAEYILDEYEIEDGEPIEVAKKILHSKYKLFGATQYLEEISDLTHYYVSINGAFGWLWDCREKIRCVSRKF